MCIFLKLNKIIVNYKLLLLLLLLVVVVVVVFR